MRKHNALATGLSIVAPAALSLLTACGSGDSSSREALGSPSASPATTNVAAAHASLDDWKRSTRSTRPPKAGCYTISYPADAWAEVACAPAPRLQGAAVGERRAVRHPKAPSADAESSPRGVAPGGGNAGNGDDWYAHVAGAHIQDVTGTFPSVSGVVSEDDPDYGNEANAYDLQINSNAFTPPVCDGYSGCYGWQQFEYSTTTVGGVFLEYWLFNYPPAGNYECPSGWISADSTTCHLVSDVNPVPVQPATNLGNLALFASAKDPEFDTSLDMVWLDAGGTYYAMVEEATTLSLYQSWTSEEFNVFGDWNSTEASFNLGTSITVQAQITPTSYPGGTWLTCTTDDANGSTAEYNNLTLSNACSANQGSSSTRSGSVQFSEGLARRIIRPIPL